MVRVTTSMLSSYVMLTVWKSITMKIKVSLIRSLVVIWISSFSLVTITLKNLLSSITTTSMVGFSILSGFKVIINADGVTKLPKNLKMFGINSMNYPSLLILFGVTLIICMNSTISLSIFLVSTLLK